jgi:hypothetical protein
MNRGRTSHATKSNTAVGLAGVPSIGHVLATYWPMRRQYAYDARIWIGRVTYRATLVAHAIGRCAGLVCPLVDALISAFGSIGT